MLLSIFRGFAANLHLIIRPPAASGAADPSLPPPAAPLGHCAYHCPSGSSKQLTSPDKATYSVDIRLISTKRCCLPSHDSVLQVV